jgi:tetratricopeptide (TPR) repeat protein
LNPDDCFYYYMRGEAYRLQEKYDAAIQHYGKAIKLKPDHWFSFKGRGISYFNKENYDSAINDYTRAIELCTDDDDATAEQLAELYNWRGVAWGYRENWQNDLADMEAAVQFDPNNEQYQENRDIAQSRVQGGGGLTVAEGVGAFTEGVGMGVGAVAYGVGTIAKGLFGGFLDGLGGGKK